VQEEKKGRRWCKGAKREEGEVVQGCKKRRRGGGARGARVQVWWCKGASVG